MWQLPQNKSAAAIPASLHFLAVQQGTNSPCGCTKSCRGLQQICSFEIVRAAPVESKTCFAVLAMSVAQPNPEPKLERGLQLDSLHSRDLDPEPTAYSSENKKETKRQRHEAFNIEKLEMI